MRKARGVSSYFWDILASLSEEVRCYAERLTDHTRLTGGCGKARNKLMRASDEAMEWNGVALLKEKPHGRSDLPNGDFDLSGPLRETSRMGLSVAH